MNEQKYYVKVKNGDELIGPFDTYEEATQEGKVVTIGPEYTASLGRREADGGGPGPEGP